MQNGLTRTLDIQKESSGVLLTRTRSKSFCVGNDDGLKVDVFVEGLFTISTRLIYIYQPNWCSVWSFGLLDVELPGHGGLLGPVSPVIVGITEG